MDITNDHNRHILAVNAGSSSIKVAVFAINDPSHKLREATVTNIGQPNAKFSAAGQAGATVTATDHAAAAQLLAQWLEAQPSITIAAIGHRMVHGGPKYHQTQLVTDVLLADLRTLIAFDPWHLPIGLQLIEIFGQLLPGRQQLVCFDTAFHHDLPARSRLLPIPRRLSDQGVRRYGFHGLSYAYILEEFRRIEGDVAANGKLVIAHLGSGASLAALWQGQSIDTTMSLTPASGIPMSSRAGDLDPGLALYLNRTQGFDIERFTRMVNFESGLLGLSGSTADMEKLLEQESNDTAAREAIEVFCYQATKSIGSLAAALGGLHSLIFTGGIGENAPQLRERICAQLEFLGIMIDGSRNRANARLISADGSHAGVHVIHTDEAVTIASEVAKLLAHQERGSHAPNN